jgi:hypothetical protein
MPFRDQLLSSLALEGAALAVWNIDRQLQGQPPLREWSELHAGEKRQAIYAVIGAVRRLNPVCRSIALRTASQALSEALSVEYDTNDFRALDWATEDAHTKRRIAGHTVNAYLQTLDGMSVSHLRLVNGPVPGQLEDAMAPETDAGKPGSILSAVSALIQRAKRGRGRA